MALDQATCAEITDVAKGSPAYDAGFEPGCKVVSVDGFPVRDIIDWRWLTSEDAIELEYIDLDGEEGSVVLERDPEEDWGLTFCGSVFDGVRTCVNACTFCFMRQLPANMRASLSIRDDDFRLSFLDGTFVTFTNVSDEDVERIVEQQISPLRVSLHAIDSDVRARLIGRNEGRGLKVLERLLDSGIEFDAQVVLVPGVNDGDVLDQTLSWAYERAGIRTLGIVPLGFTGHQDVFRESFDSPRSAAMVLDQIRPFQEKAVEGRGHPWVYAADEFYCNAYGQHVIDEIPKAEFYGDFSMFEDGIGMVRSAIDAWEAAASDGTTAMLADALEQAGAHVYFLCGESMRTYANGIVDSTELAGKFEFSFVPNTFFGGNVNITGLLCACDLADAAEELANRDLGPEVPVIAIPDIVFNCDGVTLDDRSLDDIKRRIGRESGARVLVTSSNPLNCIEQIKEFVSAPDFRR